jgi:uncharacterized protein YutE (UPF0331/DUF86 family)
MGNKELLTLLQEHLKLAQASADVLKESYDRAQPILESKKTKLTPAERETLEALTARFSRLTDYLVQRLFRTLDQHELTDEGSPLDRLNRFEKRGIISSTQTWREMRELRNEIAHEYLIEKSDHVVQDAFQFSAELFSALENFKKYIKQKKIV